MDRIIKSINLPLELKFTLTHPPWEGCRMVSMLASSPSGGSRHLWTHGGERGVSQLFLIQVAPTPGSNFEPGLPRLLRVPKHIHKVLLTSQITDLTHRTALPLSPSQHSYTHRRAIQDCSFFLDLVLSGPVFIHLGLDQASLRPPFLTTTNRLEGLLIA